MRCNFCEIVRVNGVRCHEQGCPGAWRDAVRECRWCGTDFRPDYKEQRECCECCAASYAGRECECASCAEFAASEAR